MDPVAFGFRHPYNNSTVEEVLVRFSRVQLLAVAAIAPALFGQAAPASRMSDAQIEDFLRTALTGPRREVGVGINNTVRMTLSAGDRKHDAHIQTIDVSKPEFRTERGVELNFRDCYKFNIAAYRLDRLLGLNMVPVSVERKIGGRSAAVTWWVDDVIMMEKDRHHKKMTAPDPEVWNCQMYCARVFNELVYDTDPNLGNFLIDKNWKLWMVDKSRAFRLLPTLREPRNLVKCDRSMLAALRKLDEAAIAETMQGLLTKAEMKALLARRDKIVKYFDDLVAQKGAAEVLFDLPR